MNKHDRVIKALKSAVPHTLPIFAGFWFLGVAYGIYMNSLGFSFWYPIAMSMTIFAGSMEFVAADLLTQSFNPLSVFLMTFMINARHLFYAIAMLDKYKNTGLKKIYLIFGMCDETFSINYSADIDEDVDRGWFMFFVTLLNYIFWVSGATIGAVFGDVINFNTKGIEFVMTSMFVVIFLEQFLKEKDHTSAFVGIIITIICRVIFGRDKFIILSMIGILLVLTALRGRLEKKIA